MPFSLGLWVAKHKNYKWADAKSLVEYAVSDAAEASYCDAACVTTQQTGDTRNTINLKYTENNKKNKKICKNFLKNFYN